MNESELSPKARRRLWQCISLLLRLADEAEQNNMTNSEVCENTESIPKVEAAVVTDDVAKTDASEATEHNELRNTEI